MHPYSTLLFSDLVEIIMSILNYFSSVDIETDRAMQKIIREDFKNRTIITVAHRLETIMDFDRIVVLDQGCIVEQGPPGQLLEANSAFRALWNVYKSERVASAMNE